MKKNSALKRLASNYFIFTLATIFYVIGSSFDVSGFVQLPFISFMLLVFLKT